MKKGREYRIREAVRNEEGNTRKEKGERGEGMNIKRETNKEHENHVAKFKGD